MNGRKATREERKILSKSGYDTMMWLVQKNTPEFIQIVHRDTKEEIADDITIDGYEGDAYHTKELDIEGYELVKVPKDKDGTMGYVTIDGEKRDYKEVTYYYALIITEPSFPQTGENSDKFIVLALIGLAFVVMITSKRLYNKNQKKIEKYNKEILRTSEIEK